MNQIIYPDYIETSAKFNTLTIKELEPMPCIPCMHIHSNPKSQMVCRFHGTKNEPIKHHEGNGKFLGDWTGTLNQSTNDPYNEEEMVSAMKKIFAQKTCPVEKYKWHVEYGENGLSHIHFLYRRAGGERIYGKIFKRYWKIWDEKKPLGKGHRGGYHAPVKSGIAYKEYMEKDGGRNGGNWDDMDVEEEEVEYESEDE